MIGTQAEYARHLGVSEAYVSKMKRDGKIPVRADGKIDFAEADMARKRNGDPARAPLQTPAAFDASSRPEQPAAASNVGGVSYSDARTAREAYQAKLAKLEYEERTGKLIPRREVEDAMVTAGRSIRSGLDAIPGLADSIVAAVRNGGGPLEVRQLLRTKVVELEKKIAESLTRLGGDDGED